MTNYKGAAARRRSVPPRGARHWQQPPKSTVAPAQSGSKVLAAGLIGTAALAGAYALTSHIGPVQQGGPGALSARQILGPGSQTATLAASFGIIPQGTSSDLLPTPAGRPTTNAFGFGVSGGLTFHFPPNPNTPFDITSVTPSFGVNVAPPTEIGNTSRPNSGGNFTLQAPFGSQTPSSGQSFQPAALNGVGSDPFYAGLAAALTPANATQTALNSFYQDLKNLNSLDSPFALVPTAAAPGAMSVGPQEYSPLQFPTVGDVLSPVPLVDPGPATFDQRFNAVFPNIPGLDPASGFMGPQFPGQGGQPINEQPNSALQATPDQAFNLFSPTPINMQLPSLTGGTTPVNPTPSGQSSDAGSSGGQPGQMFAALGPADATPPLGSGNGGPPAANPTPAPDPTPASSSQPPAAPAPAPGFRPGPGPGFRPGSRLPTRSRSRLPRMSASRPRRLRTPAPGFRQRSYSSASYRPAQLRQHRQVPDQQFTAPDFGGPTKS